MSIFADYSLGLIRNELPVIEWQKDVSELPEDDDLLLEVTYYKTIITCHY